MLLTPKSTISASWRRKKATIPCLICIFLLAKHTANLPVPRFTIHHMLQCKSTLLQPAHQRPKPYPVLPVSETRLFIPTSNLHDSDVKPILLAQYDHGSLPCVCASGFDSKVWHHKRRQGQLGVLVRLSLAQGS